MTEISVDLHRACGGGVYQPLLHVAALAPSITFTQRTFDLAARVILGGVLVQVSYMIPFSIPGTGSPLKNGIEVLY